MKDNYLKIHYRNLDDETIFKCEIRKTLEKRDFEHFMDVVKTLYENHVSDPYS